MKKQKFFISVAVLVVLVGIAFVSYQGYKHEIGDWFGFRRCPGCDASFFAEDEVRFMVVRDMMAEGEVYTVPGVTLLGATYRHNISFCSTCYCQPFLLEKNLKSKDWHPAKIQAILKGIDNGFFAGN